MEGLILEVLSTLNDLALALAGSSSGTVLLNHNLFHQIHYLLIPKHRRSIKAMNCPSE